MTCKKTYFYDVEIFINLWCVSFAQIVNGKKQTIIFEFSERKQLDFQHFLSFLETLDKQYLVSFNGLAYDNLMMNKAVSIIKRAIEEGTEKRLTYLLFCKELKAFSDLIIYGQNLQTLKAASKLDKKSQLELPFDLEDLKEEIKKSGLKLSEEEYFSRIKDYRFTHKWITLDLLCYWSKGLRLTKQLSLKSIACQLNYPVIQELPLAHDSIVKLEDIDSIIEYNSVHDLGITILLYNNMLEDIDLRKQICQDYKLKAMSWDAPKIASEILLQSYCKEVYGKTDWETLKEVRNARHEKKDFILGDYLPEIQFKTKLFQDMYEACRKSQNTFYYSLIIPFPEMIKVVVSYGGIHSDINSKVYKSKEGYNIISADVEALYPTQICNLKSFRYPEVQQQYEEIKTQRITVSKPNLAKYKKAGDKVNTKIWKIKDIFFKLILNSISGVLDSEFSWLFNNTAIGMLRVYNQLIICKAVEECLLQGIQVVAVNTDSIDSYITEKQRPILNKIIQDIEIEFNLKFEFDTFNSVHFKNINNYLAITDNGVKSKGATFITNPQIGNSNDFLVVPKALVKYFKDGIKPEDLLTKKQWSKHFNIFDFCASYKIAKKYTVLYKGQKTQQLNRFFVSKSGAYLYKQKKGKNIENVLKGWGVELLNRYEENRTEYDIDFRFYLSKINEVINDLESQQTKLF